MFVAISLNSSTLTLPRDLELYGPNSARTFPRGVASRGGVGDQGYRGSCVDARDVPASTIPARPARQYKGSVSPHSAAARMACCGLRGAQGDARAP